MMPMPTVLMDINLAHAPSLLHNFYHVCQLAKAECTKDLRSTGAGADEQLNHIAHRERGDGRAVEGLDHADPAAQDVHSHLVNDAEGTVTERSLVQWEHVLVALSL
jgi:hypothetical protein